MKTSKATIITLHVIIWGAVLVLPYVFISPRSHYGEIGGLVCNFFTLANILHIGLFYFNAFFLYPKFLTRKGWWVYLSSVAALCFVLYHTKLLIMEQWFPGLADDENVFQITFFPIIFFFIISSVYRLVIDKIHLEKTQLATELKFLRSQVSPHFLFNVLNNLVSMARHKSDQLEPSLIKLSELMRYMLYETNGARVPASKEIDYLKTYIDLQRLRFEDLDVRVNIRDGYDDYTIEPMLLVPLIENAFKHGRSVAKNTFIEVAVGMENDTLHMDVKNSSVAEAGSRDKDSGIGLNNLRARLNLLYPRRHKLTIEEHDGIFHANLAITLV